MSFDLWGQLLGKAAARRLTAEIVAGGGPVYQALKPAFQPVVDAATDQFKAAAVAKAGASLNATPDLKALIDGWRITL